MNLIEFIGHLREKGEVTQYMKVNYPEIDYYDAEVYLKETLKSDTDIVIYNDNKIEGMIEMKVDGVTYYNLFSLDLLVEICEAYLAQSLTNEEIAEKIIDYCINDA